VLPEVVTVPVEIVLVLVVVIECSNFILGNRQMLSQVSADPIARPPLAYSFKLLNKR
jgi:hypothetical protein